MGSGELHGVIELLGTYSTISFTDTTPENWHGLTIGFEGVAAAAVPEPGVAWLMLGGLPILAVLARRRGRTKRLGPSRIGFDRFRARQQRARPSPTTLACRLHAILREMPPAR